MNKNDESERNGFVWPVILKNPNAHANVDFYYGPYDSLDSLKEGVPNDLWVPGFTAAVQDDDGVVTEWWVQGEGASARWEQKGVRHDTYVALKGVLQSLDELEAIEKPEVGDMYLVPEEGETGSFLEYVNTGDKWELLGRNSGKTRGVLTMIESDGAKEFNGYTDMSVDLSKYVKKDELLNQDLNIMYMHLKEGYSYYYDNGVMQYSGFRNKTHTDGKTWSDGTKTAVEIGPEKNYNTIRVTEKGAYYRFGNYARWRLSPLVLAVRISNSVLMSDKMYDPYNLRKYVSLKVNDGRYTLTHNLVTSGITKDESSYSMTSSVRQVTTGNGAYLTVLSQNKNTIEFKVKNGSGNASFVCCDLFFYDFTVY